MRIWHKGQMVGMEARERGCGERRFEAKIKKTHVQKYARNLLGKQGRACLYFVQMVWVCVLWTEEWKGHQRRCVGAPPPSSCHCCWDRQILAADLRSGH